MAKKGLWGGRFREPLDPDAVSYSYSYHIDCWLYPYDIQVNKAHAKALVFAGIFSDEEFKKVSDALDEIERQMDEDPMSVYAQDEDIHSAVERLLTERLGDLGKRLHTGKSRNDQVITDVRLLLMDSIKDIQDELENVLKSVYCLAHKYQNVVFPGFTHFQPAQPILFSHHMLAYFEKFSRDLERLSQNYQSCDACPLGSGAMVGNNYGLDRDLVAKELGFSHLTQNSMDAVSDRDFVLEFISNASISMVHLSRFCEEIIVWNSPVIGFINVGDSFTTGSSIMPQKKNPDIAELIRGKSGRISGHMTALLQILKGLPLTYNRDLQEDKEIIFDTIDTWTMSLKCFSKMLDTITLNEDKVAVATKEGYLLATDFADYLVKRGIPFRESHEITGNVVLYAIENNKHIEDLTLDEFKQFSDNIDDDVFEALTFEASVNSKDVLGGTASNQVEVQLKRIKEQFGW